MNAPFPLVRVVGVLRPVYVYGCVSYYGVGNAENIWSWFAVLLPLVERRKGFIFSAYSNDSLNLGSVMK